MQSLFKLFTTSTAPTVPTGEDEVADEADEPPDDCLSPLPPSFHRDASYAKTPSKPLYPRRESLLTRAIMADSSSPTSPLPPTSRVMSSASSHSAASMASTAELTSDLSSISRSTTPSPPLPTAAISQLQAIRNKQPVTKVVIAPTTKDDHPAVADVGEAAVEKTLGRKRCIMFACGGKSEVKQEKAKPPVEEVKPKEEPPKRKCMLTFACPTRKAETQKAAEPAQRKESVSPSQRKPSPAPAFRRKPSNGLPAEDASVNSVVESPMSPALKSPMSPQAFHEFGTSQSETDAWVEKADEHKAKLTVDDCMKKENAIRQIGREAEEEAEEEEREQEELEEDLEEEQVQVDDFAPSDESDGNESDDEGGFAESDDESDAGSEYQFWAPSTTTAQTSVDNLTLTHFSSRGRSRGSSIDSATNSTSPPRSSNIKMFDRRRLHKQIRMRPGTPELPDSTDFVCGTLDEDRPLEAAYISCREQKKREKHVPIPQDIDPSFPTSDLEDNDDDQDEEEQSLTAGGPMWLKDQFTGFERESRAKTPTPPSPKHEFPFPRPGVTRRPTNARSPPPPKRGLCRSPPPRKLFGHSPSRLRSPPPPHARLRSPPGSPNVPAMGITFGKLAQRPLQKGTATRTSSLPRTPNPFYRNFNVGSPSISNVASGAVTPAVEELVRADMHVRGPVDIVMGLEKKREKRKAKFWRAHCRKAAKEQAEKKCAPGRGAEMMKELGLVCAERNRGYGLNQPQLVISL